MLAILISNWGFFYTLVLYWALFEEDTFHHAIDINKTPFIMHLNLVTDDKEGLKQVLI